MMNTIFVSINLKGDHQSRIQEEEGDATRGRVQREEEVEESQEEEERSFIVTLGYRNIKIHLLMEFAQPLTQHLYLISSIQIPEIEYSSVQPCLRARIATTAHA